MSDGLVVQLQKAIAIRLRHAADVTALCPASNIFDRSQRPERDVCIVLGDDQWVNEPHTLADDSVRVHLNLHVWHLAQDFATVKNIADAAADAIRLTRFAFSSGRMVQVKFGTTRYMRDPGGNYVHAVVTITFLMQPVRGEDDKGGIVRHPAVQTLKEMMGEARRLAAELGLTPTSRNKIGTPPEENDDDLASMGV